MSELKKIVENLLNTLKYNVVEQARSQAFDESCKQYTETIFSLSNPYHHHRAEVAGREELAARFLWETSVYWTVFSLLKCSVLRRNPSIDPLFLLNDSLPFFDWYHLQENIIHDISDELEQFDNLPLEHLVLSLSEICGQLLVENTSRTTGEFYTPLSLADHLIDLANLEEQKILEGSTVVDPSCGGGIILLSVTLRVIKRARAKKVLTQSAFETLATGLYGYDIQPFAVNLTKLMLQGMCASLYQHEKITTLSFQNVRLHDPLQSLVVNKFTYIVGNPPYFPVKREQLKFISNFDEVVYGHINLYGLFLWWAVCAAEDNGVVSFLLPQTLAGGLYFEKLRQALHKRTKIQAITRMTDRKGVVGDADQQIMAICLKKFADNLAPSEPNPVRIIVTHNGADLGNCRAVSVDYNSVYRQVQNRSFFVLSDSELDYVISRAVESKLKGSFGDLSPDLVCQNGGFVWNQHAHDVFELEAPGTIPLISSGAITPFKFGFPYPVSHPQHKRSFVNLSFNSGKKVYTGLAALVQRVTPQKTGRRLNVALIDNSFLTKYENYVVENHVNVITSSDQALLFGVTGWLNSDLAQFIFQMRNGNAQISLYEMQSLPCNRNLLLGLATSVKKIGGLKNASTIVKRIQKLNEAVYEYFGLTPAQIFRVQATLAESRVKL